MKARVEGLRDFGPALSPFNSFLFLQGLGDAEAADGAPLGERARGGAVSGVARRGRMGELSGPRVESRTSALAAQYLPRGAGAILTFGIRGGFDAGRRFIEALQLFSHLANVGDAKSLVIHPASTTHQQLSAEEKQAVRHHRRYDPPLGRPRGDRRHPMGPGPGPESERRRVTHCPIRIDFDGVGGNSPVNTGEFATSTLDRLRILERYQRSPWSDSPRIPSGRAISPRSICWPKAMT